MLKYEEKIPLNVNAVCMWDEESGRGKLSYFLSSVDVEDCDGNAIGSIKGSVDGSVWLFHEKYAPHGVCISSRELWGEFQRAMGSRKWS